MRKLSCARRAVSLAALLLATLLQRSFADGLNQWTSDTWLVSTVSLTNIWGVAYGDGVYVEAGDRAVATSTTGAQWTESAGIIASPNQNVVFKSLAVSSSGVFVLVGTYGTLFSSTDGLHWTAQSSPLDNHLYGVTWGNGKFVAVGQGTAIIESADGVNWNAVSPTPQQNDLLCVTYGNNLYVAAATNGPIYTSTTGTSWAKSANTQVTLYAMTYGNGVFVGVGDNGAVERSPDGNNWTEVVLPGNNNLFGVTFADGLFVANGQDGMVATSPDGSHWAVNSGNFGLNNQMYESASFANGKVFLAGDGGTNVMLDWPNDINGIVSAGGVDVAVGGEGLIVSSTDGANWTHQTSGTSVNLRSVTAGIVSGAFGFIAVGDAGTVEWSKDGVNWNVESTGATNDLYAVSYTSNNTFVAVGTGGGVFTSSDGVKWTAQSSGTQAVLRGIGYNSPYLAPSTVVAVGDGGTIITSVNDGATWSAQSSGDTSTQYASLYIPMLGLYVSAGADEQALLSPNATNWNSENIGRYPVHGLAYGDQLLVAAGENGEIQASPDGTNWSGRSTPTTSALYGLTLANNSFLAVGQYGTIIKSGPVLPFETLNSGTTGGLAGIALGAGATVSNLVAVGSGGSIIYSSDGVNFNSVSSPTTSALATVAFADGQYVAVGASGSILTSADGKNWSGEFSGVNVGLDGVTFGQGHYVAVGTGGTILTSTNGDVWTSVASGVSANILSVTFGNGLFIALDSDGTVLGSSNGVNWAQANPGLLSPLIGITYANGTFLAINAYGGIYSSIDGVNWAGDFSLPPGTYTGLSYLNGQLDAVGAGGTIVSTALPLGNPRSTIDLFSVVSANGNYVAGGRYGTILVSQDGQNWSGPVSYPGTDNSIYGLTYGNGIFAGVGENGWTVRSTDGLNWTSVNSGATSSYLNGITFGGGEFVAVGDDGAFISSSDGVNWNSSSAPGASDPGDTLSSVAYGGGKFVSVGNDYETSFSSPDGNTWTQGGNGFNNDYATCVTYGNGLFVFADSDGNIYTSTDGANWTQRAATLDSLDAIAYGGGLFVAVGAKGVIVSSQDGITWAAVPTYITGDAGGLNGISYDGNAFEIVGNTGIIFSSVPKALTEPVNILLTKTPYEPNSADTNDTLTAVTYGAGEFVVIGNDSEAAFTSANGQLWTEGGRTLGDDYYTGLAYNNGLYVAIDSDGGIYTSTDGNVWTRATSVQTTLNGIAFGNGVFVAVGNGGAVFTSDNGKQWSAQTSKITEDLYTVIFDGANFVASGSGGSFWNSSVGANWAAGGVEANGQTVAINALAYNGHTYVGVGAEGIIVTSTNVSPTAVWNAPTNYVNTGDYLNGVAWGAGQFIAVGRNGWAVTSSDGANWTASSSSTVAGLNAITYAGTQFVVVGGDGVILTVGQAPVVTTQPSPALQYVDVGSSVTLQVAASGSESLNYQWRNTGVNLQNGFNISGAASAMLELSNVALTNSGSYDVVVTDPQGMVTSMVAVVNVGAPPSVTTQPVGFGGKTIKEPGDNAAFSVAATGTGPLSYQWMLNGGALSDGGAILGSASNFLSLLPILSTEAGSYSVVVSSPYGNTTSSNAVLQLKEETTSPTVIITTPAPNARTNAPSFTGTAKDVVRVEKVNYWITNLNTSAHLVISGQAQLSGGVGIGASNWVINIVPTYGTNVLAVQSVNYSGMKSPTVTRPFFKKTASELFISVTPAEGGSVLGLASEKGDTVPANDAELNLAEGYTVIAKTNGGWYFANWSTNGTFATSSATFNFTMRAGLDLKATFSPNMYPLMIGRYDGVFSANQTSAPTSAGMISDFVVGANGRYSAKLFLQGTSLGFSGDFNTSGYSSNYLALPHLEGGPGPISVVLNWTNVPSFPQISGTVSSVSNRWVSQLYMPIETATPHYQYATNYVMLLPGDAGDGFAAITNRSGIIYYGGRLPNGALFSGSTSLGEDGSFPIYYAVAVRASLLESVLTNWLVGSLNLSTATSNQVPSGNLSWTTAKKGVQGILVQEPVSTISVLGSTWTPVDGALLSLQLGPGSAVINSDSIVTNTSPLAIESSGVFSVSPHSVYALRTGSISLKDGIMTETFTVGTDTIRAYGVFLSAQNFGAGLFQQNRNGDIYGGLFYVAPPQASGQ